MTHDFPPDRMLSDRRLQILFAEDNGADLELCLRVLLKTGLNFHCDPVSTLEAFIDKLSSQDYDVVLADYQLGAWTALDALAIVKQRHKHMPFILVTGTLGEEKTVECLKNGADDFILKDHLARLPAAIGQALEKARLCAEKEHAETALRESEERFRTLADFMASPLFVYQGTECRYANRAAEELTGYTQKELLNISSWEIIHPDSRDVLIEQGLIRLQGIQGPQKFELKILTKQGDAKWLDVVLRVFQLDGKPAGLFTGFDITDRKQSEEEIVQQAASDPLTRLINYRRLTEVFVSEAKRSRRSGRSFSFMLLDVDDLKKINDACGHLIGSRALCRLANILRNQCRSGDIAARFGGDEFALVLPETGTEGTQLLARRIAERLRSDGQLPSLSVSIGTAVYPQDGSTYEELFNAADRALYEMKTNGGGKLLVSA